MGHHHHHGSAAAGDQRVAAAVAINLGLTAVQVIGGIAAGSLALIADALHNFSDAISLIIAFVARRIARRPADAAMTFGYGRAEVVAALVNYTTLILIGLYLLVEAGSRLVEPTPVDGWIVVVIAAVALAVDLATALLTFALARSSVNIRAAFLHNVADALGSIGVIVAGTLVILFGWWWVDPIATALIAGYILWHAGSEVASVVRILMLGSPPDIATDDVIAAAVSVEGVREVHHAHLWQMQEHEAALDAHVVIDPGRWHEADAVKAHVKRRLAALGIAHSTLELECARHSCSNAPAIGHTNDPAAGAALAARSAAPRP